MWCMKLLEQALWRRELGTYLLHGTSRSDAFRVTSNRRALEPSCCQSLAR